MGLTNATRSRTLKIRFADRKDFNRLLSLSEEEGWNYEIGDFLLMERSGCSKTLVADTGNIVGMVTMFDYGDIGWISNLIVDKAWRGRGIGRSLLMDGIRSLGNKKTIALFSTQESLPFYLKSGLSIEGEFHFIKFLGERCSLVRSGAWSDSIELMDKDCFGYNRRKLLRLLADSGSIVYPDHGEGFAILRPGARESTVGPVISYDDDLLYSALGALGAGSTAVTPHPHQEYAETLFKVTLMYLGEKPRIDYRRAQAFAGLEYG